MTRTTPKLAPHLQPSASHQREDVWPLAGHSYLFQNGNFGTREGKNIHQGRKPMENNIAALKSRISNQTKVRQFVRRFFGQTHCEASRNIKRLT
ncbi:hypothetical protein AVEN_255485-1 [Araneus ventricosus]|uniref:Uncharacterized protein n=1 Tax=Araneus ventricosus TaxID=182803 RepID=A0A4Y2P897_ARAVE|nr:hypothetical protein AVEN_255485-1 [Araneus ventricosus]